MYFVLLSFAHVANKAAILGVFSRLLVNVLFRPLNRMYFCGALWLLDSVLLESFILCAFFLPKCLPYRK